MERAISIGYRRMAVLLLLIFPAIRINEFFGIYRQIIFRTIPADDYPGLLLFYLGQGSPRPLEMVLRVGTVLFNLPFLLLPAIPLTNAPADMTPAYMHAAAAIAFGCFAAQTITTWLVYHYSRLTGADGTTALVAALLTVPLYQLFQGNVADVVTVMTITLVLIFEKMHPRAFIAILATCWLINEKISILLSLLYAVRALNLFWQTGRIDRREAWRCAVSMLGFAAYLGMAALFSRLEMLAPTSSQWTPSLYLASILATIRASLTMKGAVLNLLPLGLVLTMFALCGSTRQTAGRFGIMIPLTLALIASLSGVLLNVGRIAFLSFTIPLPFIAALIMQTASSRIRGSMAFNSTDYVEVLPERI